jgi:hypothetical protein
VDPRSEAGRGDAASRAPEPEPRWTNAFLHLVAGLAVRPRWRDRPLPLIWLTGGHGGGAVLDLLAGRLASPARYRVPHVRLAAPSGAEPEAGAGGEAGIRPLLDRLCRKLSRPAFGTGRLWFRRYVLAAWLLDQDLSGLHPDDVPDELARRLRDRARPRRGHGLTDRGGRGELSADGLFGAFAALSWLLSRLVPQVVFRIAVSGRVPGIGRRYRWFMRQQYLAPAQSGTFLGFAERLTIGGRDDEPPDQIDRLLLHAFLEDLRQAYLRRPWRVQSWRRTAYPIVLVDDVVPGNARHALLRLVNDVRNETGRYDPLLLVGAGERAPRGVTATGVAAAVIGAPAIDPAELGSAYRAWAKVLPRTRRARGQGAWVWSVAVPAVHHDREHHDREHHDREHHDREQHAGERPPSFAPPRPPWFARRTVAAAACLLLAVAGGGFVAIRSGWPGCGHSPLAGAVSVREIGGECVGLSADDAFVFNDRPGQEPLVAVQRRIFAQDRQVRRLWERSGRRRPLATVVYFGTLTGRDTATLPDEEAYVAEREELEGLAVAQYDGIHTPEPGTPLLRVVVANGGFQMRYASEAVKMIVALARRDPTVIGVVGLVESRTTTGAALRMLNAARIPAIAPTLSGDDMHGYSRLYLQIAPPNRDQAALVERYADTVLRVRGVRIYYTVGERSTLADDRYVATLLADLKGAFGRRLESVTAFDESADLSGECGYRGMVFFAGRWSEFASFLQRLSASCVDDPPAHVVADDSVNRYMANPKARQGAPDNIPLTYVSKGALATCPHLRERAGSEEAARRFLRLVGAPALLAPPRCDPARGDRPVGERVGLTYDSAMIMLRAVQELAARLRRDVRQRWDPRSVTPLAVYTEILRQDLKKPFAGVTGDVSFDERGEPAGKVIFLLGVRSIPDTSTPPAVVFQCGTARRSAPPAPAAPATSATCRRP